MFSSKIFISFFLAHKHAPAFSVEAVMYLMPVCVCSPGGSYLV